MGASLVGWLQQAADGASAATHSGLGKAEQRHAGPCWPPCAPQLLLQLHCIGSSSRLSMPAPCYSSRAAAAHQPAPHSLPHISSNASPQLHPTCSLLLPSSFFPAQREQEQRAAHQ